MIIPPNRWYYASYIATPVIPCGFRPMLGLLMSATRITHPQARRTIKRPIEVSYIQPIFDLKYIIGDPSKFKFIFEWWMSRSTTGCT